MNERSTELKEGDRVRVETDASSFDGALGRIVAIGRNPAARLPYLVRFDQPTEGVESAVFLADELTLLTEQQEEGGPNGIAQERE